MTKLRAVLATLDHPPTIGGIQTMTFELVARARRTSFLVIAPADPGAADLDRTAASRPRRVRALGPGQRGFVPLLALAARRSMKRGDVGLAMHPLAALGFLGLNRPFVVVTHGGELRSRRIRRVAGWVFPRAARVICNSRFTRSEAIALGADPLRCEVIPPGAPEPVSVEPAAVAALRSRLGGDGANLILCVARLVPHKGQDALIESLARLPGARAVLVGTGPHASRLRGLALAKGVADRVVFAGRVSDDELPVYFAAADAFALLSRAVSMGEGAGLEGAGIAILEAMAMGVPVVAAATGGIPETVNDGRTGLLVDPRDARAVARALERVLTDRALRDQLITHARQLVTTDRSWNRFTERFEDALALIHRESLEG